MAVVPSNTVTVPPASPLPLSDETVPPVIEGAAGGWVSIVTGSGFALTLVLPAMSVAWAPILWTPSASVEVEVMVHVPAADAVPVPIAVVPSSKVTVLPAAAVPVKVGVVTLVTLSVLDLPLSDAAIRSGREIAGSWAPIVIDRALDATPTLPATSVALAVMA